MGIPVWLFTTTFESRGIALYTLRLAARLGDYGFDPCIVCRSAAQVPPALRRVLQVREMPRLGRLWKNWWLRPLLDGVGEQPPALIHAQRRAAAATAAQVAQALDKPYVVTVHDILQPGSGLAVDPARLRGVIAVSPSVERDLVFDANVPAEWVRTIPAGVETPEGAGSLKPHSVPVVAMASSLEPVKGAMYFLMAAELILSSGHDVEFLIAGAGSDEETLRRAARHLDIAHRVTFISHAFDFGDLLSAIDIFVVPSLEEGLGSMMLEAMAFGKPVVATKVGGIADYFRDGEHMLLVAKANHVVLADKIQMLLDSPARARRLAVAGQAAVIAEFGVGAMVAATADFYHKALGSSPAI